VPGNTAAVFTVGMFVRQHPRSVSFVKPKVPFPAAHFNYFQITTDIKVFVEEQRYFSDCHPVPVGNGNCPTKDSNAGSRRLPATGLRQSDSVVANDYLLVETPRPSYNCKCVNKSVYATANVLEIHNQSIQTLSISSVVPWFRCTVSEPQISSDIDVWPVSTILS